VAGYGDAGGAEVASKTMSCNFVGRCGHSARFFFPKNVELTLKMSEKGEDTQKPPNTLQQPFARVVLHF
jgi:hypothetical protein